MANATDCVHGLKAAGKTVASAESCTGGQIAHAITAVPGASSVYPGGVVSYWSEVKADVLGVPAQLLAEHGAVSEPVARAMADGVRQLLHADIGVSTTGVAGPDSDERGNPVGLVFVALSSEAGTMCHRLTLGNQPRATIQDQVTQFALDLVAQAQKR